MAANFLKVLSTRLRARQHTQEALRRDKQALAEALAAKHTALELALTELSAALVTVAEHERVQRDLEIAQQIQRQMFPATLPQVPGLHLHATTVPSRWVGGDFYDAVCLGPRRLGLLLGDVTGTGIPAAMQMARLMGEFRACVSQRTDPAGVMQVLNGLLCQRNVPWTSMVTVQYLVLDLRRGLVQYICAGHPPILRCRANGQLEHLGAVSNLPLGLEAGFAYRQETQQLAPGDRLLLYSDGAYELSDAQGARLGLSRLAALFAAAPAPPEATIGALQAALAAFGDTHSPHDDTTFLCASVVEGTRQKAQGRGSSTVSRGHEHHRSIRQ